MELLLALGADIEATDRFGGTPLDDALRERHEPVIKILLAAAARFDNLKIAVLLCQVPSQR